MSEAKSGVAGPDIIDIDVHAHSASLHAGYKLVHLSNSPTQTGVIAPCEHKAPTNFAYGFVNGCARTFPQLAPGKRSSCLGKSARNKDW
jgi:hypothetical protein